MNQETSFVKIVMLGSLLALGGCAVGALTPIQSFDTSDTLTLSRPARDFLNVTTEVGQSLGYQLAGVDREANSVTFSDNASPLAGAVVGRVRQVKVTVTLAPGGRSARFRIEMFGNMSSSSQGKANERLTQLKAALAQRL